MELVKLLVSYTKHLGTIELIHLHCAPYMLQDICTWFLAGGKVLSLWRVYKGFKSELGKSNKHRGYYKVNKKSDSPNLNQAAAPVAGADAAT